jgi:hypothetical protein
MENTLPVYIAVVNLEGDDTGMQLVSFVDEPAIECNFLSFEDQKEMIKLAVEDEDKHMCYGPIMLANKKIYRRTEEGFEYMLVFTPENIELMLQKFMSQNNGNNVDENHSFKLIDGVTLCQVFIKNSDRGINPTDFPDAEDGSLFGIYHVEDDQLWEDIKSGEVKGFSLAGVFDIEKAETEQFNKINPIKENKKNMSKLNKIKEMLKVMLQTFGDIATDKGTLMYDGDEEIKEGDAVKLLDGEGNEIDAEDGDYLTDDKRIIVISEGKVAEIKDVEEEEPKSEETPAEEPAEEEMSKKAQAFRAMAQAFEETYEEKYAKIYAAVVEKGYEYSYIVEASDEYAIISVWGEDEIEHFFKFDLTWDEAGNVSLGEPVEVKKAYVPVDEQPEPEEEQPEDEPADEPEEEPKDEEEKEEEATLSAQEEFAKLDDNKSASSNKRVEALRKRGYKVNM